MVNYCLPSFAPVLVSMNIQDYKGTTNGLVVEEEDFVQDENQDGRPRIEQLLGQAGLVL